jgi:membrane protein DedA with SNARE-associated domain
MLESGHSNPIEKGKHILSKKEKLISILVLTIFIALFITLFVFRKNIEILNIINRYSLIGVLVISFIACGPISATAIPIPYLLVIFTFSSVLDEKWGVLAPIWVGLTAAIGATMGQAITFMIGYSSHNVSEKLISRISEKAYNKALIWIKKYGAAAVFALTAVPNPVHLPVTLALGAAKFSPRRWFFLSLAGNLVKCIVIAFTGYIGVAFVFKLLGS